MGSRCKPTDSEVCRSVAQIMMSANQNGFVGVAAACRSSVIRFIAEEQRRAPSTTPHLDKLRRMYPERPPQDEQS